MIDDPVLLPIAELYRVACEARAVGARSFRVKCCAWGRPNRAYIFVHRCVARVVRRFVDEEDRDCLLVEFNVVDFLEAYRRQALQFAATDADAISANRKARRPVSVTRR